MLSHRPRQSLRLRPAVGKTGLRVSYTRILELQTVVGKIMGAISIDQLLKNPAKLIEEAESGQVAIVTKGGRPVLLAIPYDERLAKEDVHVAVAVRLYQNEVVSLGRAARIAGLSLSEFIDRLGALNIPVIRYPPEELERELAEFG